jgi:hypothetical protein
MITPPRSPARRTGFRRARPPDLAHDFLVSIAARFEDELWAAARQGLDGPELLPERLARAAAAMLPVDDAGLSLLDRGDKRVPLGASSAEAAAAERLQFTAGQGPCATAQSTGQPVFATEQDLRLRWPEFSELLFEKTTYRAIVGLPLQKALAGIGAIDLYFERSDRISDLEVFEALSVGELITSSLSEAAVFSEWYPEDGPQWLRAPAAQRRAKVWEAMGKLSLDLELDAPDALDLMRRHALAADRSVDDVAIDVLRGRLRPDALLTDDVDR